MNSTKKKVIPSARQATSSLHRKWPDSIGPDNRKALEDPETWDAVVDTLLERTFESEEAAFSAVTAEVSSHVFGPHYSNPELRDFLLALIETDESLREALVSSLSISSIEN